MSLKSHLSLEASVFDPANIKPQTLQFNDKIRQVTKDAPSWTDTGAEEYRQMRWRGDTAFPAPVVLPQGINITIPSRDPGRTIPCRLFWPQTKSETSDSIQKRPDVKGIFMHIHGGGWVLFDEKSTDLLLAFYAETTGCAVISIGYRLAPEHPWPAPVEDIEDAAAYLVEQGAKEFGGDLKFIGGESAGGHLGLLATYHLLRTKPDYKFPVSGGLVLHFPATDLSHLPSAFTVQDPPILKYKDITAFADALLPGMSATDKMQPRVSPLYADWASFRGRLPRALITCGTEDPLLDDSVFMAVKWQMAGGEAILRIYEGTAHGFVGFPKEMLGEAGRALGDVAQWMVEGEANDGSSS